MQFVLLIAAAVPSFTYQTGRQTRRLRNKKEGSMLLRSHAAHAAPNHWNDVVGATWRAIARGANRAAAQRPRAKAARQVAGIEQSGHAGDQHAAGASRSASAARPSARPSGSVPRRRGSVIGLASALPGWMHTT